MKNKIVFYLGLAALIAGVVLRKLTEQEVFVYTFLGIGGLLMVVHFLMGLRKKAV